MQNEITAKNIEARLEDCKSLEELKTTFTLSELVILARDYLLSDWLLKNLYEVQGHELEWKGRVRGDDALLVLVCDVLAIDVVELSDYDSRRLTIALAREHARAQRESECGTDGYIVTNQAELCKALSDDNVNKVYLYSVSYSIPMERSNTTYVGRDHAVINIWAKDCVLDFDGNRIYFYGCTLIFHYLDPSQVMINDSRPHNNNMIFLQGGRLDSTGVIDSYELAEFLKGRKPFEDSSEFAKRAAGFKAVIVGTVTLRDTDYDLWHEGFFLKPDWRPYFNEQLRRFVGSSRLVFSVPPKEAESLYNQERVFLVYADFATEGDWVVIDRLYLRSSVMDKEYVIHRLYQSTSWAFGSGSGDAGYGLDLIAVSCE